MKQATSLLIGILFLSNYVFADNGDNWSCNVQQIKLTTSQDMKNVISGSSEVNSTAVPTQSSNLTESLGKIDRALTANCQIGNAVKQYKTERKTTEAPQSLGWFYQPRQAEPMKITLIPGEQNVKISESNNQSLANMVEYLHAGNASIQAYLNHTTVRDDLMLCFYTCFQTPPPQAFQPNK